MCIIIFVLLNRIFCAFFVIIIIIIILFKQDYEIQLTNIKIQMAWLTSWLVVG